jgi:hypothetical protein
MKLVIYLKFQLIEIREDSLPFFLYCLINISLYGLFSEQFAQKSQLRQALITFALRVGRKEGDLQKNPPVPTLLPLVGV